MNSREGNMEEMSNIGPEKAYEPSRKDAMTRDYINSTSNPLSDHENRDQLAKSGIDSSSNPPDEPRKMDPNDQTRSDSISSSTPFPGTLTNSDTKRATSLFVTVGPPTAGPIVATTPTGSKTSDAKRSDSVTNIGRPSCNSTRSDSLDSGPLKPHTGGDGRWEAIQLATAREAPLGLSHFRLLKRLGYGDIGSVYLVELRGTNTFFAMKVMDKASLASRNKLLRAQTEKEILGLLDHPFLPTLYSSFETDKFYCLVMEFCSGGNLHSLRQKQPNKYFSEQAARLVHFF